jgi:sulfur carrier protein ThiS
MKKILPYIFILFTTTIIAQAPECHWVTRLTGAEAQSFTAVQTNNKGETYAAGFAYQNTQIESFCDTSEAIPFQNFSAMLVKLSAAGDPIWRKDFNQGGGGTCTIRELIIDDDENIYIVGEYAGPIDFNLDLNTTNILPSNGIFDIFLVKYDSLGNYIWGKNFGGNGGDGSFLIDFSTDGNIILSGAFNNQIDLGTPINPIIFNSNGDEDIFTSKINSFDGSTIWAKQVGGIGYDTYAAQTIDNFGNIYLVGQYLFSQPDVDPGPLVQLVQPMQEGFLGFYILKLNSTGDFVWVKQYEGSPGTSNVYYREIEIGIDNSFFIPGVYNANADFDFSPNSSVNPVNSASGGYLGKYDLDGNLIWVKNFDSINFGGPPGFKTLKIGNLGGIYLSGYFSGSLDFNPNVEQEIFSTLSQTIYSSFLYALNSNGDYNWAIPIIATTNSNSSFTSSVISNFTLDSLEKNFYYPGEFQQSNAFEPGNDFFTYDGGFVNGFIAKYSFCERLLDKAYIETCEPFYEIAGQILDSSGFYTINNRSIEGCDSVTCLTLKLNEALGQLSFQSCSAVEVNGQIYESSGIYQQIFDNGTACDSVLVIQVAISSPSSTTLNIDDCDPVSINGITYSTSGQFTQLLQNASGCDSILTINAEILNLNAQVFQTDSMLYVNGSPTSIQWINCTTGQAIVGATQTSFVPQTTGNYGAVITIGECVDTSNCRLIIKSTAVEKPGSLCDNLIVTPNPVHEQIEFTLDKSSYDIRLFTSTGALVISTKGNAQKQIINFRELAPAMYVLEVDECRYKIVKQ